MEEDRGGRFEKLTVSGFAVARPGVERLLGEANESGRPLVRHDPDAQVVNESEGEAEAREAAERQKVKVRRLSMQGRKIVSTTHREDPKLGYGVIRNGPIPLECQSTPNWRDNNGRRVPRRVLGTLLRRRRMGVTRRPGFSTSRSPSRGSPSGDPDEPEPRGSRAACGDSQTTARHRLPPPSWWSCGDLQPHGQLQRYLQLPDADALAFAEHILSETETRRAA